VILRKLYLATLLLALLLNSWDAGMRVQTFLYRYRGEKELNAAALSLAYDDLSVATARQPGDSPGWILLARTIQASEANGIQIAALSGKRPEAKLGIGVDALARAITLNPADAWAWFNLADLYRGYRAGVGRLERMRAVVAAANAGVPDPASVASLPDVHRIEPEDRIMAAAGEMATGLEPNFHFYHDFLALLYWEKGSKEASEREIQASFALMPIPSAHAVIENAGFASAMSIPILKGIDDSERSPSSDGVTRQGSRAEFYRSLGRGKEAIEAYLRLRELGNREAAIASDLNVGEILLEEGENEDSLVHLSRVLEEDPKGDSGTTALYYLGVAYARQGDHAKAVAFIKRYLGRRAGTIEVVLELAGQLATLGQELEAERTYLSAVRGFPDEPEVYVQLIRHLVRQRRMKEAQSYLQRLKEIAPEDDRIDGLVRQITETGGPYNP
jgi:tetratricopeptide (TPR) repeat protein